MWKEGINKYSNAQTTMWSQKSPREFEKTNFLLQKHALDCSCLAIERQDKAGNDE